MCIIVIFVEKILHYMLKEDSSLYAQGQFGDCPVKIEYSSMNTGYNYWKYWASWQSDWAWKYLCVFIYDALDDLDNH